VEEKSTELDTVRNKVNQLETTTSKLPAKPNLLLLDKQSQTEVTRFEPNASASSLYGSTDSAAAKAEPRVTFDLGPVKPTTATVAASAGAAAGNSELRRPADKPLSQLPSDARQRLQEMAGLDIRRNYRKTSETFRPAQLNLTAASNATNAAVSAAPKPPSAVVLSSSSGTAAANMGATTTAGRTSPTKAYTAGAVMATTEPSNHHHHLKNSNNTVGGSSGGGGGGGGTATALLRKDSRSNARNSLVTVQNSNNQKRPHGGAVVTGREVVMNNPNRNAINGNRTRTPSIERSIISNKDDQKDANKVRPKSFWGGWWKF
jgi:hypothetical protein